MKQPIILGILLIAFLSCAITTVARTTREQPEALTVPEIKTADPDAEIVSGQTPEDIEKELGEQRLEQVKAYFRNEQRITEPHKHWIYTTLGLFLLAAIVYNWKVKKLEPREGAPWVMLQLVLLIAACAMQTYYMRYGFENFITGVMNNTNEVLGMLGFFGSGLVMMILVIAECVGFWRTLDSLGKYAGIREAYLPSLFLWIVGIAVIMTCVGLKPIWIPTGIYCVFGAIVLDLFVTVILSRKRPFWLILMLVTYLICLIAAIQFFVYAFLIGFWLAAVILVITIVVIPTSMAAFAQQSVAVFGATGKYLGRMVVNRFRKEEVEGFEEASDGSYVMIDSRHRGDIKDY